MSDAAVNYVIPRLCVDTIRYEQHFGRLGFCRRFHRWIVTKLCRVEVDTISYDITRGIVKIMSAAPGGALLVLSCKIT